MGDKRLGTLPDTRPWRRVVAHIAEGAGVGVVAAAATNAAASGLRRGENDHGVAHVVFLLARTAVAARKTDFSTALAGIGIHTSFEPSLFELTASFTSAMRVWYSKHSGQRTDIGEIAVLAGTEALTVCVGERVGALFVRSEDIKHAVREFSTKNGFATLAHEFFSCFIRRFLLYHLGRELSQHVGGNSRFADDSAHTAFMDDLRIHCRETALIAREYSGGWYEKARFEEGITERQAQQFTAYCLGGKLRAELAKRGERNG